LQQYRHKADIPRCPPTCPLPGRSGRTATVETIHAPIFDRFRLARLPHRARLARYFVCCRRRSIACAICSCSSAIFVKPCFRKLFARARCHSGDSSRDFSRSSSVDIFCPLFEGVARGPPERGDVLGRLLGGAAAPRLHQSTTKIGPVESRRGVYSSGSLMTAGSSSSSSSSASRSSSSSLESRGGIAPMATRFQSNQVKRLIHGLGEPLLYLTSNPWVGG